VSERKAIVHLVPHTHWDREWYEPFQTFRMRLVALIDDILERMKTEPGLAFTLDGQLATVDDYLAIRPEAEAAIRSLVRGGRLAIGPWQVLMDEFLVSGETIVRNLEMGWRRARELGSVMEIGYLPDMFGHVAQMPQILRRAGLVVTALLCLFGIVAAQEAPPSGLVQEQTVAPGADYRFGPGDVLSLRIWNGQKIDELKLTVQSDGEAFLPVMGIGALPVAGRTVVELKVDIEKRFQAIYKETHVELLITRYAGHRVSLMGEVKTTARNDSGPGSWALEGPTRLVEFLSAHGGPAQDADVMRIQVIRPGAPRRELNLFRAVFQGNENDDPWLRHGDLVFIPSLSMGNRKVFVLGEVNQPGVVNIIDKMGLVEAISRAGGFSAKGYMKGVVVLKRGEGGKQDREKDRGARERHSAVSVRHGLERSPKAANEAVEKVRKRSISTHRRNTRDLVGHTGYCDCRASGGALRGDRSSVDRERPIVSKNRAYRAVTRRCSRWDFFYSFNVFAQRRAACGASAAAGGWT